MAHHMNILAFKPETDDIRTKLLDSMISRLQNRMTDVYNEISDIPYIGAYARWTLFVVTLVLFCLLRYGVETVDVHQAENSERVVYKDRQLERTSKAFPQRHERDR